MAIHNHRNVGFLHIEGSFKDAQYAGPQDMNIVMALPSGVADQATVRIVSASERFGYCGNGTIPSDSSILPFKDFTLTGQETVAATQEATVPITGNQMIIPIYCHDYGAWCEVEITLKKNGVTVGGPISLTLPRDDNRDTLADVWQRGEVNKWNQQFHLSQGDPDWIDPENSSAWAPVFGHTGAEDAELADSDGDGGPMPAMEEKGDGLKAHEEYRGFILDGGPDIASTKHRRLSAARKELLVECSEMEGIGSTALRLPPDANTNFTDQGNDPNAFAQGYSLTTTMSRISAFFALEGPPTGSNPKYFPGAAIDTWWVKDKLNDMGYVAYENGAMGSTHKYSGPYKDLQRPNDATRDRNGWLSIASDHKLADSNPVLSRSLYGGNSQGKGGGQGVAVLGNYGNRNDKCIHFVKLAVQGRKGYLAQDGNFYAKEGEAAREQDERQENRATHQGAAIFINSLSEEPDLINQAAFEGRLEWAIAHELAHLFVGNDGDHFDGSGIVLSKTREVGLSKFVEDEIINTKLRQRASINRDANGNPQP